MELNYDEWKRKDIYEFFSSMSNPFYMVTFREDVTNLYRYTKAHGLSFYAGMIWACTQAFNQTEAFLIRLNQTFFRHLKHAIAARTFVRAFYCIL